MALLPPTVLAHFGLASHTAITNLDVALDWAAQGYCVFPCYGGGPEVKRPIRGIQWRNLSTSNATQIQRWWEEHPDAVPGLDAAKAGLVLIDCDRKPGQADGVTAFHELCRANGYSLEDVPTVTTPNNGIHYAFRQWASHGNGRGNLPAGIDVRGAGGYVIAPGSTFIDGRQYVEEGHLSEAPDAPIWLIEILEANKAPAPVERGNIALEPAPPVSDDRKRVYGHHALEEECRTIANAGQGSRNETINISAFRVGQLVGGGCLTETEAFQALSDAAKQVGFTHADLRTVLGPLGTIKRALRAGAGNPRGPEEAETIFVPKVRQVIEHADGTLTTEDGEIIEAPSVPVVDLDADELPLEMTRVAGLLGELTQWICDTSRRPQPALALGAALTIIGTACGRHLAGPTGSGTHLYVLGLAKTGAGKDHALQQIGTVLEAANMKNHIGPSQFISMPAVINFLARAPLSVCAMDEFGSFMKRINNKRASGFEGAIGGILRTLWGTSFRPMATPEWAGRAAETIIAPAMSIYGASTAEEFYSALEGGDTSNGVLNRMLVIETKQRPVDRDPSCDPWQVPERITRGLRAIYERQGPLVAAQLNRFDMRPNAERATWGAGAQDVYKGLVESINARCDGDVMAQAFYARTAEMAVRMATILAAGCNPARPVVLREHMDWAANVALWSARMLQRGATDYISDSENQQSANLVRRTIRESGRIKHRDLLRKLGHRIKARDLEDILKMLQGAEQVIRTEQKPAGGGTVSVYYSTPGDEA